MFFAYHHPIYVCRSTGRASIARKPANGLPPGLKSSASRASLAPFELLRASAARATAAARRRPETECFLHTSPGCTLLSRAVGSARRAGSHDIPRRAQAWATCAARGYNITTSRTCASRSTACRSSPAAAAAGWSCGPGQRVHFRAPPLHPQLGQTAEASLLRSGQSPRRCHAAGFASPVAVSTGTPWPPSNIILPSISFALRTRSAECVTSSIDDLRELRIARRARQGVVPRGEGREAKRARRGARAWGGGAVGGRTWRRSRAAPTSARR